MLIPFILYSTFGLISTICMFYSPSLCFKPKKILPIFFIIPPVYLITNLVIFYLNGSMPNYLPVAFISPALFLLLTILCLEGPVWKKTLFCVIEFTNFWLSELISLILCADFFNEDNYNFELMWPVAAIECFIILSLTALTIYIFRRFIHKVANERIGIFIVFPICQSFFIIGIAFGLLQYFKIINQYNAKTTVDYSGVVFVIFTLLAVLISVIADILLYRVIIDNAKNKELQDNLRLAEYRNRIEYDYYSQMKKNNEETRKIRHDFYNIITAMENGSIKVSEGLTDELMTELSRTESAPFCNNEIVNLIMQNKKKMCDEKNIELTAELFLPNDINIKMLDLVRVFTNILDNAIEANEKLGKDTKRYIKLSSKTEGNYLYIKAENPSVVTDNSGEFRTNKKKKKLHGYGLIILNDIAKSYDGTFSVENQDNIFTALLALRTDKEEQ